MDHITKNLKSSIFRVIPSYQNTLAVKISVSHGFGIKVCLWFDVP